jgi:PIN domain nuclease of toxin-antitoxin system
VWEIGVKVSVGKLTLPSPLGVLLPQKLQQTSIRILEVRLPHVDAVSTLPFYHKDPFDRMLVAQCLVEQFPLLSADVAFDAYGIQRVW